MDYVEFHFNGPVLRAISHPTVKTPSGRYQFPYAGSRDALCSLITREVVSVALVEAVRISLALTGGFELAIPLDEASRRCPEAAHFQSELVHSPRTSFFVW